MFVDSVNSDLFPSHGFVSLGNSDRETYWLRKIVFWLNAVEANTFEANAFRAIVIAANTAEAISFGPNTSEANRTYWGRRRYVCSYEL